MKFFFCISHPKHVYMFKALANRLTCNGHVCRFIAVDKEMTIQLLDSFGLKYYLLGENKRTLFKKAFQQLVFTIKVMRLSHIDKPDVYLGGGVPYCVFTAFVLMKPYILLEDTRAAVRVVKLLLPLVTSVITYKQFSYDFGKKHIKVDANTEMLYLHDSFFKPDESIFRFLGLAENEKFVLIRYVSWNAFHDVGKRGLSNTAKSKAVIEFSKYAKVFISTEYNIEEEYKAMEISIPKQLIHSLEYYADLVFGESPTMTTESAMLGTPSICVTSLTDSTSGNFKVLKEAGLSYSYHPDDENDAISKGIEVLQRNNKANYQDKAKVYMSNNINYVEFLQWYLCGLPSSHYKMLSNPEYAERFK